jgi:hypothetical protein
MIGRPTAALGFVGVRNKGYTKDIPNNNGYDSASWRGLIV